MHDSQEVSAGFDTLMRQGPMTAQLFMMAAVKHIDGEFGRGYAKEHPEFVAAYMRVSMDDLANATMALKMQELRDVFSRMADALDNMS